MSELDNLIAANKAMQGSKTVAQATKDFGNAVVAWAQVVPTAPPPTPTPTPTPTPPAPTKLGNQWSGRGLANLEIGKTVGREVAIQFRAVESGIISDVRFYLIFRATGYYMGNGGQVKVEIRDAPDGKTIGVPITITDPMNTPFRSVNPNAQVTAGQVYYVVFTNPYSDPVGNYVSLDDLAKNATDQVPDPDLKITWKYDSASAWIENTGHSPIVQITYASGTKQGQGYVDCLSSSGLVTLGSVTEQMTPNADMPVSYAMAFVRKGTATGNLIVTIGSISGSLMPSSVDAEYSWVKIPIATSLKANTMYPVTLTGAGYQIYPLQKGTSNGFSAGVFDKGHYVSGTRTDLDLPLYLG